LKADPTEWLLETDNPSVRYFTLLYILERGAEDVDVAVAKQKIMQIGAVPKILSKQENGGYWGRPEDFYIRAKYGGTAWTLNLLAELGANGEDERVRRACEFILEYSMDGQSGGFSYLGDAAGGGARDGILPCLTGNMVWSLLRFGFLDDERLRQSIDWFATYQRFDDGTDGPPEGWPYRYEKCWGGHTCHMGAIKALKALSEIPPHVRSHDVKKTIEDGAEYFLSHHVHKRSHDLSLVSKKEWLQFGFPLFWKSDALEVLLVLTKLGYRDRRMREAVDLVLSKQDDAGRWTLDSTFNRRMQVSIERKGKPSKWVTLNALKAIKGFHD